MKNMETISVVSVPAKIRTGHFQIFQISDFICKLCQPEVDTGIEICELDQIPNFSFLKLQILFVSNDNLILI
jgi:hypothetical protein